MPRPKRSKVAPHAPGPRVGKAPKASTTVDSQVGTEKEDTRGTYDISDPDEGVVTSTRRVKRSKGKGRSLEIQHESRGVDSRIDDLENLDSPAPNLRGPATGTPSEETLLGDLDLESSSPSMEVGRRDRSTAGTESSLLAIGNFKRRPRQGSIIGRAAARARSSSIESNLAEGTGLMSVGRESKSKLWTGTCQRHRGEAIAKGGNSGRIRSSSFGLDLDKGTPAVGSAMKLGNFKRRAREPSILGTAQKKQQRVLFDDDDDEDEDDFNPDDESTPLNLCKTRTINTSSAPSSSSSRKRKLSAVQIPQSQSQRSTPSLPAHEAIENVDMVPASRSSSVKEMDEEEDEVEEELVVSSPPQEVSLPSIGARTVTPEPLSETMAPPQSSSSSPPSSPVLHLVESLQTQPAPSRGRRPLRSQTPLLFNEVSPPSSPPSLTHSPNRPGNATAKQKTRKQPPRASTLSTAQLQALLPRRRRRARDEFDIASSDSEVDASGLASDDDELTHLNIRAPSRRSAVATAARLKAKLVAKTKAEAKITYGSRRKVTSDKENEEEVDPDDSLAPVRDEEEIFDPEKSQELEKRVGKELKRAAKKFAEVDKWEMEFEDVTASSSSPKDAR